MKYMIRFHRSLGIALIPFLFFVFIIPGCMPRMAVKETAHYKSYENILLKAPKDFGTWTKTDIYIPQGAMIAVMAKGEIWDTRDPDKLRWQPSRSLRFRVGVVGPETPIIPGIDSKNRTNRNFIQTVDGGYLYLGIGAWWRKKDPRFKQGTLVIRAIVWEKRYQARIEDDLLELIRHHPEDHQIRDLVSVVASCFLQTGEYERVQNLHKMMRETPEIEWDRTYPSVLLNVSDVEKSLGKNDKAKAHLEESLLLIRRFGNPYMEIQALRRLATIASNSGKYKEARNFLTHSLNIAKKIRNPEAIAQSLSGIGYNLMRMDRPLEAVDYFENALKYFHKQDRWLAQRKCYFSLGESYARLNRHDEAYQSFESAIQIAAKVNDPGTQWAAYAWLGRITEAKGNDEKAFENYAKAITILESVRAKFTDPSLRALFMKNKFRVYDRMIQLLYRMQRFPEALHYLERAKARVMLDLLGEKALFSKHKEENELLAKERTLSARIDQLSTEQEKMSLEELPEPEEQTLEEQTPELPEPAQQVSELKRLQSQHQTLLERIERLNPELASLVAINPLKADEIQALLDSDAVILEYFLGVGGQFIFVVTREKISMVPLGAGSEKLFQKIKEFRNRVVEGITLDRLFTKTYERPISELYEILIHPIEGEISGKRHLVIVPHGMLHYLPFQALLSKRGKYLIESFTISYLPSASILKYAHAKNKGNRVELFAAGNPSTGLTPLPAAEEEVRELSTLFKKKLVLTGREATKTSVKRQSPKYDLLHFSTHGEMIESNPLRSNLRFAPSAGDDGKLTVNEIFDMDIKANLVTLSACETALVKGEEGDFPKGDDLVGLSRAFIHAGAPSVVASLWKVSDNSTVALMRAFYQNLRSMTKAEALQKAQIDLMKSSVRFHVERGPGGITRSADYQPDIAIDCSHPFFWAPFILVGDWR
jgi:CHAT domain-containing protein